MAVLMCLDCFKTYDSLIQHNCLNRWWIPGVASRSTTVEAVAEDLDSMKQESTHGPCVEINETASFGTELVNINPAFYTENYLYNQVTYAEEQPTYSSQDYITEGSSNHLITMNSEQGDIGEWGIGDLNNQARRIELGGNDCDMEMRLSSPSSEISSKIGRLTSMVYQFGLHEDNLNMPSIPDSSNNRLDFVPVDGTINGMSMYKVPMLDVFENAQSEPKIENDPLKLMNKLVERGHTYEICSKINDAPVINEERGLINHELLMGNKHDSEKAEDKIGLSEIYRQFSKYGQINEIILTKDDLDSMKNNSAFTEAAPSRDFVLSNIPTHGFPVHTGSMNAQVRIDRTNVVMLRHKCNNASTEVNIGFNDMNFRRGTEESAKIVNSFTEKSVSFEDYHVDAAHALAGTSFSQFNEHYTSVWFQEFQPNGNVKLHSIERNSHLKKDKIIHKGINLYKCNVCKKSFRQKCDLQRHALTHTGEKPFKCDVCGNSFRQKSALQRHALTHTGETPFKCDVCGNSFRQKSDLQRHALTHTGEKPFKCDVCGKSFRQTGHLQRHALTHTVNKLHECIICGKKFSDKSNLLSHSKTHKLK
ncbi:Zinc finger protein 33A [Araneus ventricosus]|uniref:Zinc finger protein 33A n=1 Tax=Araneus ventricosus TaxID=182803 RepID=A0A4Y2L945_ARAVE|nr:Zinc finger protein 33A [Araneus ventricosus]